MKVERLSIALVTGLFVLLIAGMITPAHSLWTKHYIDPNLHGAAMACAVDIDDDGDLDVVASGFGAGDVRWYEHINDTLWIRHDINQSLDGAYYVCAANIDNDNDIDVIATALDEEIVVWYENTLPDSSWTEHTVGANLEYAGDMDVGDIDNDNDIDVVACGYLADVLICYLNPTWTPDTIDANISGPGGPFLVNIDSDNDSDVVVAAYNFPAFIWYENVLPDSSWPPHIIDQYAYALYVYAADINEDNYVDIVATADQDRDVMWYENPIAGVHEETTANSVKKYDALRTTIFRGPLILPEGTNCRVFDITGRVVAPDKIKAGIYFIEVEGTITQKVVKIR